MAELSGKSAERFIAAIMASNGQCVPAKNVEKSAGDGNLKAQRKHGIYFHVINTRRQLIAWEFAASLEGFPKLIPGGLMRGHDRCFSLLVYTALIFLSDCSSVRSTPPSGTCNIAGNSGALTPACPGCSVSAVNGGSPQVVCIAAGSVPAGGSSPQPVASSAAGMPAGGCLSTSFIVNQQVGQCASSPPSGLLPTLPAEYIALGDSLTVGMGTMLCPPIVCTPVTTPTRAGISNPAPTTPANGGYAQIFAVQLARARAPTAFTFDGLGVVNALTGGAPLPEINGDVLTNPAQMPALPSIIAARASGGKKKLLITLWIGSNDVIDATGTTQCQASGQQLKGGGAPLLNPCNASGTTLAGPGGDVRQGSFYAGYKAVLTKIADLAPDAVIVINISDFSHVPLYANASASTKVLLAQNSIAADAAIQAALTDVQVPNVAVLDIYKYFATNPQYFGSTYFSVDGFHPNDQGYAIIEQQLYATYAAAFPGF